MIHIDSGHLPDDFNIALWFFSFSLIYLLYSTQLGMIQYSLNKIDNVQPVIKKGMGLLITSCILLIAAPFFSPQPILVEAVMFGGIEDRRPVDERTTFSRNDDLAALFLKLGNVKGRHAIRMSWINPKGVEHFVDHRFTPSKVLAKYMSWWSYIYIMEK